jgi:hypothetical protein
MVKERNRRLPSANAYRIRRLYHRTDNVFSKRLRIFDGSNGRPWALKEAFRRW